MSQETGTARVKRGMAEMLKGGVIMDVVNAEQAKIAEDAGAVAVMALERVPADIRAQGGVARMSDPDMIEKIQATVSIPVMAKVRIGHFVEAQILESLNVDYIGAALGQAAHHDGGAREGKAEAVEHGAGGRHAVAMTNTTTHNRNYISQEGHRTVRWRPNPTM